MLKSLLALDGEEAEIGGPKGREVVLLCQNAPIHCL